MLLGSSFAPLTEHYERLGFQSQFPLECRVRHQPEAYTPQVINDLRRLPKRKDQETADEKESNKASYDIRSHSSK